MKIARTFSAPVRTLFLLSSLFLCAGWLQASQIVYVAEFTGSDARSYLGMVDLQTGSYTRISTTAQANSGYVLGLDSTNGGLYSVATVNTTKGIVASWDTTTGTACSVGSACNLTSYPTTVQAGGGFADGTLYSLNYYWDTGLQNTILALYSANLSNGTGTRIGALGTSCIFATGGLAGDSGTLYFGGQLNTGCSAAASLYTLNTSTGVATAIAPLGLASGSVLDTMTFVSGTLYGFMKDSSGSTSIYTINTSTGALSFDVAVTGLATNSFFTAAAAPSSATPEPATLAMMGFGLSALIAVRKRYL